MGTGTFVVYVSTSLLYLWLINVTVGLLNLY